MIIWLHSLNIDSVTSIYSIYILYFIWLNLLHWKWYWLIYPLQLSVALRFTDSATFIRSGVTIASTVTAAVAILTYFNKFFSNDSIQSSISLCDFFVCYYLLFLLLPFLFFFLGGICTLELTIVWIAFTFTMYLKRKKSFSIGRSTKFLITPLITEGKFLFSEESERK